MNAPVIESPLPPALLAALAELPPHLRPPVRATADPVISDMWAPPPGRRWTADRGSCPGEPTYFLDIPDDMDVPLDAARFAIVSEEPASELGEVYDLSYAISPEAGGECLGRYGSLALCAAAAEHLADHLPPDLTRLPPP